MGKNMQKIKVQGTEISVNLSREEDYISLTDMLKAKDGEFATIKSQAGLNSYKISVKEWVAKTNAIGLFAKAGRYGGTYAHFIADGLERSARLTKLNGIAIRQMQLLTDDSGVKRLGGK